ncbi:general transcription factor IIH subunit 2-like [Poecilia latipinna]|nr:PREDICTED: general transcription factor IIH subunit 2-like [Poecilia latipinna]
MHMVLLIKMALKRCTLYQGSLARVSSSVCALSGLLILTGTRVCLGFPQHTVASLSDQDVKPSFNMSHLDSGGGPALTLGGYFCPQCQAKYTELPVECKVCGLTLVSAPHLARSFHHLFPLQAFIESPADNYQQNKFCQACQGQLKDKNVLACPLCCGVFCGECDLFIHESLHCCPCCIHNRTAT